MIACITGSIAEAYYTIPFWIKKRVIDMLKSKELLYPSYIMFSKSFINNV